jgi:hypothetical protein
LRSLAVFYTAIVGFWILIKGLNQPVLCSHWPNKAILVPGLCWATVGNGNSIRTDVIEDAIEMYYNDAGYCSSDNIVVASDLPLQDKHTIHALSVNMIKTQYVYILLS